MFNETKMFGPLQWARISRDCRCGRGQTEAYILEWEKMNGRLVTGGHGLGGLAFLQRVSGTRHWRREVSAGGPSKEASGPICAGIDLTDGDAESQEEGPCGAGKLLGGQEVE